MTRPRAVLVAAVVLLATSALLLGCGGSEPSADRLTGGRGGDAEKRSRIARAAERVTVPACPGGVADCRRVSGRIVYVERVDPDGDGDAHFAIAERPGVTLPGLTVIDVRAGLRPRPLPGPGQLIAAAGPVQTGSFGQSQVHALAVAVARPGPSD